MEQRIDELELKFTEQAELLEQLSDVVVTQSREIDRLNSEVSLLKKKLQGEPGLVDASDREKPPHY